MLRSALTAAVRLRMLPSSPCVGVRLPRATKNEQHYLTAAQVTRVAEAIDPHYRVAVYTAAWTGLRSGELWALRRKDVDLLGGSVHVRRALKEHYSTALPPEERGLAFGPTKTHGDRVVSLPRFLRTMLDEHMATLPGGEDTLIFTTPSGTPVRHGLLYRRRFKPAVYAALPEELHGLRFHDLRHTCASLSISRGAHPLLVKQHLRLAFVVRPQPWEVEKQVIAAMCPPLNSKHNGTHVFFDDLERARAGFRAAAHRATAEGR